MDAEAERLLHLYALLSVRCNGHDASEMQTAQIGGGGCSKSCMRRALAASAGLLIYERSLLVQQEVFITVDEHAAL